MFSFQNSMLCVTLLFTGLVAGLLYGYSCSVNIGLHALPDVTYLRTMQSINTSIQNPYFFTSFMGLLFLLPVTVWQAYSKQPTASFYLLLMAAAFYFIGVFGITVFGNVPLNNQLAAFDIASATPDEIIKMRLSFEGVWNSFHFVRTLFAILSFLFIILSIIKNKV